MTHSGREPRLGAEADAAVGVAEEHVAGDERPMGRGPEHDFRRPPARERLEPGRQGIPGAEDVAPQARSALDRRTRARGRVQPAAVAAHDLRGAADVPEHRDEHVHRGPCPLDVAV
jgi:hypothetical protein